VLRRKDGLFAYALAVVVDDAQQNITHVVRGRDLLPLSFAQLELFHRLGLSAPAYAHVPLISDASGIKLSKQTGAPAIKDSAALENLRSVLRYLRQESAELSAGSARELLDSAVPRWRRQTLVDHPHMPLVYRRPATP
jgi:glutamyl-Q tRNA(Asp) synthetase